jgi:hypothetical protein
VALTSPSDYNLETFSTLLRGMNTWKLDSDRSGPCTEQSNTPTTQSTACTGQCRPCGGQALSCNTMILLMSMTGHSLNGGLKVLEGSTVALYTHGNVRVLERQHQILNDNWFILFGWIPHLQCWHSTMS